MKACICYNATELEKLLSGYVLRRIKAIEEDDDTQTTCLEYHFLLPNVDYVHYYMSFCTSMIIYMDDGVKYDAIAENVNTSDVDALRINNNYIISPKLSFNGGWIEATEHLRNWLYERGITDNELEAISKTFTIYETVKYEGVIYVYKRANGRAYYSSDDLVLEEREIEMVLDSIKDELLREKIRAVLYARVLKKGY